MSRLIDADKLTERRKRMAERERYKTMICIPSGGIVSDVMYDAIVNKLSESLSKKVLDVIQDGKEYIVSMGNAVQEERDCMIQYRMYLDMTPLVRCKDCKWQRDCEESVGSEYFCADGVREDHETN